MSHIPDTGKMVGDTPRTDRARLDEHDPAVAVAIECSKLERELNTANDRIKRLEDIIEKASKHFRSAGPNAFTAREMADVLKEAKP